MSLLAELFAEEKIPFVAAEKKQPVPEENFPVAAVETAVEATPEAATESPAALDATACQTCNGFLFWHSKYDRMLRCMACQPDPPRGLLGGIVDLTPGRAQQPPADSEPRIRIYSDAYVAQHFPPWPNNWSRKHRNQSTLDAILSPPLDHCTRCSSREYRDMPIHAGRSTRRDCARCGITWGFPVWSGSDGDAPVRKREARGSESPALVEPGVNRGTRNALDALF